MAKIAGSVAGAAAVSVRSESARPAANPAFLSATNEGYQAQWAGAHDTHFRTMRAIFGKGFACLQLANDIDNHTNKIGELVKRWDDCILRGDPDEDCVEDYGKQWRAELDARSDALDVFEEHCREGTGSPNS